MEVEPGADMLLPAISHCFDELRPASHSNTIHAIFAVFDKLHQIVVLDALGRHPESASFTANVGTALTKALMCVDRVPVVLAHKEDWQLLEHGEVQALGKDAF